MMHVLDGLVRQGNKQAARADGADLRGRALSARRGALTGVLALAVAGASVAPAEATINLVRGKAWGASGSVAAMDPPGGTVGIGRVALQQTPCEPKLDKLYSNQVDTSKFGGAANTLALGTVLNTGITTAPEAGKRRLVETATVEDVSALDGHILATALKTQVVRDTSLDPRNSSRVTIGSLTIKRPDGAVHHVELPSGGVAPNTVIPLDNSTPPKSYIRLHERDLEDPRISASAMRVHLDKFPHASLGLLTGDIYIAKAQIERKETNALLRGYAFGLKALSQEVAQIGEQASVRLPCEGGEEEETQAFFAGPTQAGNPLLTSATMRSFAEGTTGVPDGLASSHLQRVNLFPASAADSAPDPVTGEPSGYRLVLSGLFVRSSAAPGSDLTAKWFFDLASLSTKNTGKLAFPDSQLQPNARTLEVPGVGVVELNRQFCNGKRFTSTAFATFPTTCPSEFEGSRESIDHSITGVYIRVLDPVSGFPPGTVIKIAEAATGMTR